MGRDWQAVGYGRSGMGIRDTMGGPSPEIRHIFVTMMLQAAIGNGFRGFGAKNLLHSEGKGGKTGSTVTRMLTYPPGARTLTVGTNRKASEAATAEW
jgi:hypothetical protein